MRIPSKSIYLNKLEFCLTCPFPIPLPQYCTPLHTKLRVELFLFGMCQIKGSTFPFGDIIYH